LTSRGVPEVCLSVVEGVRKAVHIRRTVFSTHGTENLIQWNSNVLPGLLLKDCNEVRVEETVRGDIQVDRVQGVEIVCQIIDAILVNSPSSAEKMSDVTEED
jgi:hypothetical protein